MRIPIAPALSLSILLLAAQSGGFLTQTTFEGTPAVTIANDRMALTVLTQGSTIASLVLADDPDKLSPYWNPVRMNRELGRSAQPATGAGHFVCVDGFGPVSPEEQAAGLQGHGEAHRQTYQVRSKKDGHTAELTLTANLPIVQENFSRTFRIVDGENVVYVESSLESLLGFDHPLEWAEHATVGSPYLESGVTVFDVSGSKSQTRPYERSSNTGGMQRRLTSGQDFTWPMAPAVDGKTIDMRTVPGNPHYLDHTTTLFDPSRSTEWVTSLNPKRRLILGYVLRREDYPWLQTWGSYPANGKFARGMEFGSQPYDVSRRDAVNRGSLFQTPAFAWLPAKSKKQTRFLFFYTRVPEQLTKVDNVRLSDGQIVIEDRTSGKQVTLRASLGQF